MGIKKEIEKKEEIEEQLKEKRKELKVPKKKKELKKVTAENIETRIRKALDTSPNQSVISGGLFIDYAPDLSIGKVKKYREDEIKEPFIKLYQEPDKELMQTYMNPEFKVIYEGKYVADIVYTQYVEITDPDKYGFGDGGFGFKDYKVPTHTDWGPVKVKIFWAGLNLLGDPENTVMANTKTFNSEQEVADYLKSDEGKEFKEMGHKVSKASEFFKDGNEDNYVVWRSWGQERELIKIKSREELGTTKGTGDFYGIKSKVWYESSNYEEVVVTGAGWNKRVEQIGMTDINKTSVLTRNQLIGPGKYKKVIEYVPIASIHVYALNKEEEEKDLYKGPIKNPGN